jgi:hypothetical protein
MAHNVGDEFGYSGRALQDKLGMKQGMVWVAANAPESYPELLGPLPSGMHLLKALRPGVDGIHFFARTTSELATALPDLVSALCDHGMLWLSWPKRTSILHADLDEAGVRTLGLGTGLVDTKVCAVDRDWSALKFMHRKERSR